MEQNEETKYATARQAYEDYGVPRSLLHDLVDAKLVRVDSVETFGRVLHRYYREDLRKIRGAKIQ